MEAKLLVVAIFILFPSCFSDMTVKEAEKLMLDIRKHYPDAAKVIAGVIWDDTVAKNDLDGDGRMSKDGKN